MRRNPSAADHINDFSGVLGLLQDADKPAFDDRLQAIFLLMTLPESWESLVIVLSNTTDLT